MSKPVDFLCDPVLIEQGVLHGFGTRGAQPPENTAFPKQVHGIQAVRAADWSADDAPAADAIVSTAERARVGISGQHAARFADHGGEPRSVAPIGDAPSSATVKGNTQ